MRLIEPDRHEGLSAQRWDERAARRTIETIARDCEDRFSPDDLWPPHPLDAEGEPASAPFTMLYMGAAGVIWAVDSLARRGLARSTEQFAPTLAALEARNLAQVEPWGYGVESFLMGRSGVLLTHYRVRPSREVAERLGQSIAANAEHPSRELLWGAPGTMHAALAMHEWTGEERWAELFRTSAKALEDSLIEGPEGCRLWDQDLYGHRATYLGAGHGFAGNAGAIVRGLALFSSYERAEWIERIVTTALATVTRDGALANWAPSWLPGRPGFLVQWCHGAPGFVTSLATLGDSRLDDVLIAAEGCGAVSRHGRQRLHFPEALSPNSRRALARPRARVRHARDRAVRTARRDLRHAALFAVHRRSGCGDLSYAMHRRRA